MSAIVVGYAMGAFGFGWGALVFEAHPDSAAEWGVFVASIAAWPICAMFAAIDPEQRRRRNR